MAEPESLRNRVEWFIEKCARPDDLRALLRECVEDGGLDALACVRRLYEDMCGGMTFNYELKAPAASTLLVWKELGLKALSPPARFRQIRRLEPRRRVSQTRHANVGQLARNRGMPMTARSDGQGTIPRRLNSSTTWGQMAVAWTMSASPSEVFCLRSLSTPRPYSDQAFLALILSEAS